MIDLKKITPIEIEKQDKDYILVKCIDNTADEKGLTKGHIYMALNGGKSIVGEPLFKIIVNDGGSNTFLQSAFIRI